jgi:hypothetical protein
VSSSGEFLSVFGEQCGRSGSGGGGGGGGGYAGVAGGLPLITTQCSMRIVVCEWIMSGRGGSLVRLTAVIVAPSLSFASPLPRPRKHSTQLPAFKSRPRANGIEADAEGGVIVSN